MNFVNTFSGFISTLFYYNVYNIIYWLFINFFNDGDVDTLWGSFYFRLARNLLACEKTEL